MLPLQKAAVVWHVLPVFPVHGPLPAHHLLSAFPATEWETAGESPLVQTQSFPPRCCMLHASIFSQAGHPFPSPPAGELGDGVWTNTGQCCSACSRSFCFVGLFRGVRALELVLLKS